MTAPSWLTDKAVKVLAAKHLPVVRVKDGVAFYYMRYSVDAEGMWWPMKHNSISVAVDHELRAAWERLESDCATPEYDGGGDEGYRPAHKVPDGFYYLEPGGARVPDLIPGATLPELVPCEDMAEKCWPVFVIGSIRDLFDFRDFRDTAALVFHLPERACDTPANVQVGTVCPDCNDTGLIPEQIHVETRKDGGTRWTIRNTGRGRRN